MTKKEISKKLDDMEFELIEIAKALKERSESDPASVSSSASHLLSITPQMFTAFRRCNEGDQDG